MTIMLYFKVVPARFTHIIIVTKTIVYAYNASIIIYIYGM